MLPHPAHPRQVVLELRQLDLELPLRAHGVLGEDVEDQLRAVDHARLERVLEVALLGRVELVVDEEALGARLGEEPLQLLELPLPDVRPLRRPLPVLDDATDGLDARRPRELLHLGELLVGVRPLGQDREHEAALRLGRTWNHRGDYARSGCEIRARGADARARRHRVAVRRRARPVQVCPAPGPALAHPGRRRVAPLRQAERAAARVAGRPYRHGSGPGQPPRAHRGRRRPRSRRERHEGRPGRDDRARALGRRDRPGLRPGPALLPPRGARPRRQPAPGRLRGGAARRRGCPRRVPRADRQHAPARLPREPHGARRLRGPLGALGAAVAGRERDRARRRRVARRS